MQVYGGVGMCDDFSFVVVYVHACSLRIVDGLDEVYCNQIGRLELGEQLA